MRGLKSLGQMPERLVATRCLVSFPRNANRTSSHIPPLRLSYNGSQNFGQRQIGNPKPNHLRPVMVSATDSAQALPTPESRDWKKIVALAALFAGWYLANIYFNIYNKQVLAAFPYPLTLTTIQFAIGGLLATFAWTFGLQKRPVIQEGALNSIVPLACIHVVGNMLTNVSLRAVAVSFTHTVKAMEPAFSVMMSAGFLGYRPSLAVVASLVPIISGVALASTSELTFNWIGFLAAMGSNLTFQSRNVLSKKFMLKGKAGLDNVNLFSIITIMAFFILAPIAIAVEGVRVTPAALSALPDGILRKALVAGLTFHAYQQISYLILQRVSPVTHAVGNCIKRVVVIVASVIAFNTAVTQQNALGTALALFGVFLYSRAKQAEKPSKS